MGEERRQRAQRRSQWSARERGQGDGGQGRRVGQPRMGISGERGSDACCLRRRAYLPAYVWGRDMRLSREAGQGEVVGVKIGGGNPELLRAG